MSEVAAIVRDAWKEGIGPDDRQRLAAALATSSDGELRLFAALYDLLAEVRVEVPPAPPGAAAAVLHLAAEIEAARLDRAPAALDRAIAALTAALEALTPAEPYAESARAWADLALGDVALMIGDLATARRRYEAVTATGRPIALRITALLKLAQAALARVNVEPARRWARRALTLAEHHKRYEHATRARLLLGMLDHLAGDQAAMRRTLAPHAKTSVLARILLASTERAGRAMPLLADGLRAATEQGDVMSYTLCILVGARRYAAIGHAADALVTISAGMAQLANVAPHLAGVLHDERESWRKSWGDEAFAAAEAAAIALLDS